MEASVAAPAADGTAEAADAQAPAVDLSPVLQQIEALGGRLGGMEQMVQQFVGPEAEGGGDEDATLAALAEFYGGQIPAEQQQVQQPQFNPEAASQLVEALEAKFGTQVQSAVEPLLQQVSALTAQAHADQLQTKYPELKDPEVAKAVVTGSMQMAQEMGFPPEAGKHPAAVSRFYESMRYQQIANGEVPVDSITNPTLEPGGGASPRGGIGSQGGTAADIVAARGGNSFWGT